MTWKYLWFDDKQQERLIQSVNYFLTNQNSHQQKTYYDQFKAYGIYHIAFLLLTIFKRN